VWAAGVYAELGDRRDALAWLETALAKCETSLALRCVDLAFDPIRDDPAFRALEAPVTPSGRGIAG
jgi:hypothetical protein